MSHLISGNKSSMPGLFIPEKEQITSKYRKIIKPFPKKDANLLHRNLSVKEHEYMKKKNETWIKMHYSDKKTQTPQQSQLKIQNDSHLEDLQQMELKEWSRKYHNQICSKMRMIREAKNIDSDKKDYTSWLNSINNSPIKSPNFNKMNFILEKLSHKENNPLVQHHNENKKSFMPIIIPHKGYIPRGKRRSKQNKSKLF